MYIQQIKLVNYRNIQHQIITLSPIANAIIGDNAQGKTNILESIFLGARGKVFRTNKEDELILHGEKNAIIKIDFNKNDRNQTLKIVLEQQNKKKIWLNGVPVKKNKDLFGVISIVFFSPLDLKLTQGGPTEKRKFINREISNVDKRYLDDLINYHKILSQRNSLLKKIPSQKEYYNLLDVFDEQITSIGQTIIQKRITYIKKIEQHCQTIHYNLSHQTEKLTLTYQPSIKATDNIKQNFIKKLKENREKDIKYGYTNTGLHKDDLLIKINSQDIRKFASQGQQRTAALSLKLSELKLIEDMLEESPILLLDDVMSELDLTRQSMLMNEIKQTQTIITTTDLNGLDIKKLSPFKQITIKNGSVISSEEVIYDN